MPKPPVDLRKIQSLVEVVAGLRGPDGCPWDQEQTHISLTQYAIEEVFELTDAIESKDDQKIKDELGDVLFQVILHAQLASERKAFTLEDVIENLNEKLIRRHPHVFAGNQVSGTEEVIKNWELLKKQEARKEDPNNILNVPTGLPALQRAFKIGKRTEKLKFDWDNPEQVWLKMEEERLELREALDEKSIDEIEHEIGDVLFSVAQLARHLDLEPEQVLRKANRRFESRFAQMKKIVSAEGHDFDQLPLVEKEAYWQKAKLFLKSAANTSRS